MVDVLTDLLVQARVAYSRGDWRSSHAAYVRVDGLGSMPSDDLGAFAASAWWLGNGSEAVRLGERVYDRLVRTDQSAAARIAVELASKWTARGHDAIATSWRERARVLLLGMQTDDALGYLAYVDAVAALNASDRTGLAAALGVLRDSASRSGDGGLGVLGDVTTGLAALMDGDHSTAYRLIDAAMLPVVDSRVPLHWADDVYGVVLVSGGRWADAEHEGAWVQSMRRWCESRGLAERLITGSRR